ncbi:MAG: hypothetical protein LIP09_12205 [Bacteroidales bacterium]|nr:hypothetical protein [Bacteroidales bacterium]
MINRDYFDIAPIVKIAEQEGFDRAIAALAQIYKQGLDARAMEGKYCILNTYVTGASVAMTLLRNMGGLTAKGKKLQEQLFDALMEACDEIEQEPDPERDN